MTQTYLVGDTARDDWGLFGQLTGTSLVKRVIIKNASWTSNRAFGSLGLLVGIFNSSATIEDCYVQGSVSSTRSLSEMGGW